MGNSPSSTTITYANITNPIKEGYLEKRTEFWKTYKKRWIVLAGHMIYSFKTKDSGDYATEVIDLRLYNVATQSPSPFYENQFELIASCGREFFIAASKNEMNDWVNCINNAMIISSDSHTTRTEFISSSVKKKKYYNKFPSLNDYANCNNNDDSKEDVKLNELTNKILSSKPSGDPSNRDTLLHILNAAANDNGKHCLFYDSSQNIIPSSQHDQDSYLNIIDDNKDSPKFVLTLNNLTDYEYDERYDENEKLIELKNCVETNNYNPIIDDIQAKLAQVHGVSKNRINIKDIFAGTTNVAYTVDDLTTTEKNKLINEAPGYEQKMKTLFKSYKKLSIHPLLFHHTFDISMFDAAGNKTFGKSDNQTFKVGPKGKEKEYKQPSGWTRYGLKVLGKYPDGDKWLHPFQDPGNWYRAFHGTSRNFGASIYENGFRISNNKNGTAAAYGDGVYCSPDVSVAEGYANGKMITISTKKGVKKFKFVFQACVNPNTLNQTRKGNAPQNYWVAPTAADIRPYAILIKEQ